MERIFCRAAAGLTLLTVAGCGTPGGVTPCSSPNPIPDVLPKLTDELGQRPLHRVLIVEKVGPIHDSEFQTELAQAFSRCGAEALTSNNTAEAIRISLPDAVLTYSTYEGERMPDGTTMIGGPTGERPYVMGYHANLVDRQTGWTVWADEGKHELPPRREAPDATVPVATRVGAFVSSLRQQGILGDCDPAVPASRQASLPTPPKPEPPKPVCAVLNVAKDPSKPGQLDIKVSSETYHSLDEMKKAFETWTVSQLVQLPVLEQKSPSEVVVYIGTQTHIWPTDKQLALNSADIGLALRDIGTMIGQLRSSAYMRAVGMSKIFGAVYLAKGDNVNPHGPFQKEEYRLWLAPYDPVKRRPPGWVLTKRDGSERRLAALPQTIDTATMAAFAKEVSAAVTALDAGGS